MPVERWRAGHGRNQDAECMDMPDRRCVRQNVAAIRSRLKMTRQFPGISSSLTASPFDDWAQESLPQRFYTQAERIAAKRHKKSQKGELNEARLTRRRNSDQSCHESYFRAFSWLSCFHFEHNAPPMIRRAQHRRRYAGCWRPNHNRHKPAKDVPIRRRGCQIWPCLLRTHRPPLRDVYEVLRSLGIAALQRGADHHQFAEILGGH